MSNFSAARVFMRGIDQWLVDSPYKGTIKHLVVIFYNYEYIFEQTVELPIVLDAVMPGDVTVLLTEASSFISPAMASNVIRC